MVGGELVAQRSILGRLSFRLDDGKRLFPNRNGQFTDGKRLLSNRNGRLTEGKGHLGGDPLLERAFDGVHGWPDRRLERAVRGVFGTASPVVY